LRSNFQADPLGPRRDRLTRRLRVASFLAGMRVATSPQQDRHRIEYSEGYTGYVSGRGASQIHSTNAMMRSADVLVAIHKPSLVQPSSPLSSPVQRSNPLSSPVRSGAAMIGVAAALPPPPAAAITDEMKAELAKLKDLFDGGLLPEHLYEAKLKMMLGLPSALPATTEYTTPDSPNGLPPVGYARIEGVEGCSGNRSRSSSREICSAVPLHVANWGHL